MPDRKKQKTEQVLDTHFRCIGSKSNNLPEHVAEIEKKVPTKNLCYCCCRKIARLNRHKHRPPKINYPTLEQREDRLRRNVFWCSGVKDCCEPHEACEDERIADRSHMCRKCCLARQGKSNGELSARFSRLFKCMKGSDKAKKRLFDFADRDELIAFFNSCESSKFNNDPYAFEDYDGSVKSMTVYSCALQISVDRILDNVGHLKSNCRFVPLFMNVRFKTDISGIKNYVAYIDTQASPDLMSNIPRSQLTAFITTSIRHSQMSSDHRGHGKVEINTASVIAKLTEQNGKCYKSGLYMTINPDYAPFRLSIDRIDNAVGYTNDNIRLVCLFLNFCQRVDHRLGESSEDYQRRVDDYYAVDIKYDDLHLLYSTTAHSESSLCQRICN